MEESIASCRVMNNSSLADLLKNIALLMHDEPVVQSAIRILTSYCLASGIQLSYGYTNTPPTPNFKRYLDKYFVPFCRDAIVSYLAVGFVPYRIRQDEKGVSVPEVLPLGTFTWHVGKGERTSVATPWQNIGKSPSPDNSDTSNDDKGIDQKPILKYVVQSAYCREKLHVFSFVNPQILFSCTSPFASLVQPFLALNHKRDCILRADSFNSKPTLVFEQQEKVLINEINNSGLTIQNTKDMDGKMLYDHRNLEERQCMLHQLVEESKPMSHLPGESITFIAPKNNSVHGLDKALTPVDIFKDEFQFSRLVGMACGLPVSVLVQGGGSIMGGNSGGSNAGWAENVEGSNRLVLDTCKFINRKLEELLQEVYKTIYGCEGNPKFEIPVIPTIPFEQLILAYESQIIDDKYFSMILMSTWGFPLSENASIARSEKRKAEFVLPFKDKKDDSSSSSTKAKKKKNG